MPILKVEPKNGYIYTIEKLNDDRIGYGFSNGNIIVFSKEKYEKEIELNDYHKGGHITFLTQLNNRILISCGSDGKINFFKILENQCSLFQSINVHGGRAMEPCVRHHLEWFLLHHAPPVEGHDDASQRSHHQYGFAVGTERPAGTNQLLCCEGRPHRSDQGFGAGSGRP